MISRREDKIFYTVANSLLIKSALNVFVNLISISYYFIFTHLLRFYVYFPFYSNDYKHTAAEVCPSWRRSLQYFLCNKQLISSTARRFVTEIADNEWIYTLLLPVSLIFNAGSTYNQH